MAFSGNKGLFNDINVTPFVDVMLVLLVIFMITAPLMFNGIQLNLPKTREVNPINLNSEQIVLSYTQSQEFYVGKKKILKDELIQYLQSELKRTGTEVVFLRADETLKYGFVAKLMSFLKKNGFSQIALVTEIEKSPK
ncbi:MAG: ExbD/TolR family protein [Bacteriovoracaceae bacterium]